MPSGELIPELRPPGNSQHQHVALVPDRAQCAVDKLAYQALKYQQRDGWSHRDLLRLSHPRPKTEQHKALYHWITQGWPGVGDAPHSDEALRLVWATERAKRAEKADEIVGLIRGYNLPRPVGVTR